ncbi:hypothetical protein FSPOR_3930 [Fusarium sporotrichioides]|uniref:Mucin n=1 Tax=Fusarium sporotrichioides TaxID=5514 RepID=A0A395SEY5_FUSSP|nr:hypothetical protein FSPOR_3930 [Fusarium sporotrichioides]
MGQGDGLAALDSRLRSGEGYWPNPGTPAESIDSNSMSLRDSSSLFNQGPDALDDIMSFLDSETLDSCPNSSSHLLHPRPLHHYTNQPNHTKRRVHAESSHAHAYDIQNMHSQMERQKPPLQPQRQRRVPTKLDTSDFTHHVDQDQGLGDLSFLLPSRPMSIATTAMTTNTTDNGFEPYPPPARPGKEQIELRVPPDARPGRDSLRYNSQQYRLSAIDTECLFPDDGLSTSDRRPSSSRSHIVQWRRSPSANSDSVKHPRVSSDLRPPAPDNRPSATITREEFESLPPTIQRKYFSTIERSQLAHSPDLGRHQRSGSVGQDQLLTPWSSLPRPRRSYEPQERPITSDASLQHLNRPRIASTDQRFYANLPEKIKRRHLTDEELLFAYQSQETPSETTEELPDKIGTEWQSQDIMLQSPIPSPRLSSGRSSYSNMLSRQNDKSVSSSETTRPDSFYDSFRWLDDEEGLDLRLYLDDYHINLREEVPVPNKSRRPSFRRHLSINKLPFGRPSMACDRLAQEEIPPSPTAVAPSVSRNSVVGPFGHSRKKSRARALSLISANRQSMISPLASPIDPAATHYQDPEARKKLRECLASPQKFDEAIEFGFFSKDGGSRPQTGVFNKNTAHQQDRLRSFLEDDRSSKYSDDASAAEPDSPKTPQLFDRAHHIRSVRNSIEHSSHSKMDKYMPDTVASREMTLRMTLTRPDLRQSEDQIYGWKQGSSHGGSSRDEPALSPAIYSRGGNPKQSIERQLTAFDQWEDHQEQDSGAVKRLWNRVRRS